MPCCVVKGCICRYTWNTRDSGIILHVFPRDPNIIRLWLQKTGLEGEELEVMVEKVIKGKRTDAYRMCSVHFSDDCYIDNGARRKLKKNAIPTIFPLVVTEPDVSTEEPTETSVTSTEDKGKPKKKTSKKRKLSSNAPLYQIVELNPPETVLPPTALPNAPEPCKKWRVVVDQVTSTDPVNPKRFGSGGVTPKAGKKHAETQTSAQMFKPEPETRTEEVQPLPGRRRSFRNGRRSKHVLKMDSGFHESDYEEEEEESFYAESDEEAEGGTQNDEFKRIHEGKKSPVREKKFIVFESCLNKLLAMIPCQAQSECGERVTHVRKSFVGSSVIVKVKCASGHTKTIWESQPRHGGQPLGDVLTSAAVLYSGCSFPKILQMVKLLNLKFIGKSTYYKNQTMYLFPTLNRYWQLEQQSNISRLREKPVCLTADCQVNRPGHLAKYLTYTMMDAETKKIIGFHIQQLLPSYSQDHHENTAFKKTLDDILEKEVNVKMVTTNPHVGIRKVMKDGYANIIHRFDPWHLARTVGNKILAQSKKKHCEILSQWASPIESHLWWSVKTCGENGQELLDRWNGLQYHVLNVHEWYSRSDYWKCRHDIGRSGNSKPVKWIPKGSLAYRRLRKIVLNPLLQKQLKRVTYFCHADALDILHSTCRKYRPRGVSFHKDEMVARTQLAVLDYNRNVQRVQAALKKPNTDPAPKNCAKFTKSRKAQVVKALYECKGQDFILDLLRDVVTLVRR
ncbi:uncharacterized protein [Engystomops pustulosus]|uniref:uncharacterized protein isoform X1 n=1 Tax=Engystomops pustulosus TaxID=76066 RepID=UPI003AFB5107